MANPMADEMRRFKGSDEKNPFEAMSERFDRAANLLGLDEDLYQLMRVPSREIKVYIPVRIVCLDDLEMCGRQRSFWRRQGGHYLRPVTDVGRRTRTIDSSIYVGIDRFHWPRQGFARPGYGDQRADDGVDNGHVLNARTPHRHWGCHR